MTAHYEACFWAWVGMMAKDQGLAQAHESLDQLIDAAHAASPVVQVATMDMPTIRRLAGIRPKPNTDTTERP
ncbi:MAG: hypothetical protein Q8K29_08385 [Polaromonas sp.]|nr:hypothetical protein [Polaromonas sp.]